MNALQTFQRSPAAESVVLDAPPRPLWMRAAKRLLDITFASVALLVTAPVVFVAIVGILVVDFGNPIFRQERVGRDGRRFMMFKLRTMVHGAHDMLPELRRYNEADGPVFKFTTGGGGRFSRCATPPRLHALGSLLRRASIDELPNFVNVLLGDMS